MVVGNAKRDILLREEAHDLWPIPTGVAELETVTSFRRQHAKKARQAIRIGPEVGWQLKKNRAGLVAKHRQTILHQFEAVD
jgi:hypothetical protein